MNASNAKTDFEKTAIDAENLAQRNIHLYKTKLFLFALLGYAVIFLVLMTLLGLIGGIIASAYFSSAIFLLLLKKKLFLILIPTVWILLKSLWVRFDPPSGYQLKAKQCPKLFSEINQLRKRLNAPKIHQVILTPELNASITQTARLGLLGWQKNTLTLGLELLLTLSPEQARAVIAHELGHLSGNHSRFNGWIYRIRFTWHRIMYAFDQSNSFATKLMGKFFDWYAPRFSAYSFALARANEYEADAISAEITSAQSTADALISTHVTGPYIDENYWDVFFKKADDTAEPEHPPWNGLSSFLSTQADAKQQLQSRLENELKQKGSFDDTHPSLRERIQALNITVTLPEPIKGNAATEWFGNQFQQIIDDFDTDWMSENADRWKQRNEYVTKSKKTLEQLHNKEILTLDDYQLWELATLTEELVTPKDAFPLYKIYQQRYPENPSVAFVLGRIFYDQEDESFITEMKIAITSPDLVIDACQYCYYYLTRKERENEAQWWREKAEEQSQINQENTQQRSNLNHKDILIKADISTEYSDYIINTIKQNEHVSKVWIAEKQVTHYPETPVLAIAIAFKGFFISHDDEITEIINDLDLNCNYFVVPKIKDYKKLTKLIIKKGEQII